MLALAFFFWIVYAYIEMCQAKGAKVSIKVLEAVRYNFPA
jgi:hypothetical protein